MNYVIEVARKHMYLIIYNILVIALLISLQMYDKRIVVEIDGDSYTYYSNIMGVDYFVEGLAEEYEIEDYELTVNHKNDELLNNSRIKVNTEKSIVVNYLGEVHEVKTFSSNYDDILIDIIDELGLETGENLSYGINDQSHKIESGIELTLNKFENIVYEEREEVPPLEEVVENPDLTNGVRRVKVQGTPTIYNNVVNELYVDGVSHSKTIVESKLVQEGTNTTVELGTKILVFNPGDETIWDQIASCESGGNWGIDTNNGYYGGLQFNPDTWRRNAPKVGVTAAYAHQASREEQILVAEYVLSLSSWKQQWPSCSKKLGLW